MTQSPRSSTYHTYSANIREEKPSSPTAASIASDHFKKELALHTESATSSPETTVIIHDACYGHRFSRPKTNKTTLSLIVERPERLQAGVTGIASAYVRLGGRYAGAENPLHPSRALNSNAPFSIRRSTRVASLSASIVTNVHGAKWMQELTTMANGAADRLAAGAKELARHDTPSGNGSKPQLHEGDLYLCRESLDAFQGALGGVLDGVDAVFGGSTAALGVTGGPPHTKRAFVCVRPPGHHCSADLPSGFCWLNNVHIGIEHAAQMYGLTHAAIIDFDLHHGNGSQDITWDRNAKAARAAKGQPQSKKTSTGYFSLHDINSYPCEYGDIEQLQAASLCLENAHNQTIWNVHLQPWSNHDDFWILYESRYMVLLEKARVYLRTQTQKLRATSPAVRPKSAIFISAGFDASEWEGAGMQRHKVNVPTEFYARFTQDIIRIAEEEGTSAEGRVISVLEGGYSDRALMSGVLSHLSGLTIPKQSFPALASEGLDTLDMKPQIYDTRWWSSESLAKLEALSHPTVQFQSKKTRTSDLSTFASPTQSFTAKAVDPSKVYRSLSGAAPAQEPTRPPTPPPPDVDWATAAHELSKLLIPSDRIVDSCKHEELNEPKPKPKPKRERHSAIGLPTEDGVEKIQTRGRKSKVPSYPEPSAENGIGIPLRQGSGSNRRQTISELPVTEEAASEGPDRPTTSDSKAHSEGSTVAPNPLTSTSGRSSRAASPKKATKDEAKVHRTRRASGAVTDLMQKDPNVKAPPIPKVPIKYSQTKPAPPRMKKQETASSTASTDMDNLTNGVKKITLKMPQKDPREPFASSTGANSAKPARKPPIPRTTSAKSAVPKSATGRPAKSTKASAPGINPIDPSSGTGPGSQLEKEMAPGSAPSAPPVADDVNGEAPSSPKPTFAVHAIPSHAAASSAPIAPPSDDTPMPRSTGAEQAEVETIVNEPLASETVETLKPRNDMISQDEQMADDPSPTLVSTTTPQPAQEHQSTDFIPYNPSSDFASSTQTQLQNHTTKFAPLTWLPPNTNTPAQTPIKQGKENLPVFSATGAIPFGAQDLSGEKEQKHQLKTEEKTEVKTGDKTQTGQSIWDVPATPRG